MILDLTHLSTVAVEAARAAGTIIREHLGEALTVHHKAGGDHYASQVLTKVDLAAEQAIVALLRPSCAQYDLALLTEETPDDGARLAKDYCWCVDPLDGTLAFVEGRPGFSVSIALVAQDGTPHLGVVYDPSTDTLYQATRGQGALKNGLAWSVRRDNDFLTYVTDKPLRDTPRLAEVQLALKPYLRNFGGGGMRELAGGGAVLNAIRVVENGPAVMLKLPKPEAGGGSLWDYAATACLFAELGLSATDFEGNKLDLNRRTSTFLNHAGVRFANVGGG